MHSTMEGSTDFVAVATVVTSKIALALYCA